MRELRQGDPRLALLDAGSFCLHQNSEAGDDDRNRTPHRFDFGAILQENGRAGILDLLRFEKTKMPTCKKTAAVGGGAANEEDVALLLRTWILRPINLSS